MTDLSGAVIQRDGKTYAVTTGIPAGVVTPEQLETIAAAGRKFRVPVMKITSGQRILFAGLQPEDVPRILSDLGPLAKPETEPCVKFVQACLGTDMCKYGKQDSIGLSRMIDDQFKGRAFPAKIKIGVSGCPRCCSESHTRDIGMVATRSCGKGPLQWRCGGLCPAPGRVLPGPCEAARADSTVHGTGGGGHAEIGTPVAAAVHSAGEGGLIISRTRAGKYP